MIRSTISISLSKAGIHDDVIYELATMQVLLGGGGSFSAGIHQTYFTNHRLYKYLPVGGPGKGMYSRLYTHILNHHAAIDHCASFHHIQ